MAADDRHHAVIQDPDAQPALQTRVIAVPVEPALDVGGLRRLVSSLGPTFTRYCIVGGSGYFVNAAVFWVAARTLPYPVAFATSRHRRAAHQFGRFLAVSVAALVSDLAVLSLLVESALLPEFLAALVAIAFTTPVSFGANRVWTFSHR